MVESGEAAAAGRPGIREALAGKRILLTGVTGFLGTALLERLLSDTPTASLVLLVRGRFGSTPEARMRELLGRSAFDRVREDLGPGAVDGILEERIELLEGDVSSQGDLP